MSTKAQGAKYDFGLKWTRLMPLNDDRSIPAPDNLIGGVGPFDFSGVPDSANVEIKWKDDNNTVSTDTIDLATGTGSVDESAVTVAEIVTAFTTALITDITASEEANGRLKIVWSGAGTPTDLQVFGEFAPIVKLGQGYSEGAVWINSDTLESLDLTPTYKDSEQITQTDADGTDIEIETDSYRKGSSGTLVDTADDKRIKALIEGGTLTYDSVNDLYTYEAPTVNDSVIYFMIEFYYAKYCKGTSLEADIIGYEKTLIRIAKGTLGDKSRSRDWAKGNYNWTATSFKESCTSVLADEVNTELTVEQYEGLDLPGRDYEAA